MAQIKQMQLRWKKAAEVEKIEIILQRLNLVPHAEKSPGILESQSICRDTGVDIAEAKFGAHCFLLKSILESWDPRAFAEIKELILQRLDLEPHCYLLKNLLESWNPRAFTEIKKLI